MEHFSIFVTYWFGKKTGVVTVESTNSWDFPYCCLNDIRRGRGELGNAEGRWGSLTFQAEGKGHTREGKPGALRSLLLFSLFPVFEDKTKKV